MQHSDAGSDACRTACTGGLAARTHFGQESRPTAIEALEAFTTHEMQARHYRADTRRSYTYTIRAFLRYAPDLSFADQLDLATVTSYQQDLERRGLRGATRRIKLAAVKAFISYLEDQNLLPVPFSHAITLPTPESTVPKGLNENEVAALRRATTSRPRDHAIVEVLLQTGIQLYELVSLTLDDLTLPKPLAASHGASQGGILVAPLPGGAISSQGSACTLWVRKQGRGPRAFPLDDTACQALATYLAVRPNSPHPNLFLSKVAKPLRMPTVQQAIKKIARQAGVTWVHAHVLRATYIAHQFAQGTPMSEVKKRVAHQRIESTRRYTTLLTPPTSSENPQSAAANAPSTCAQSSTIPAPEPKEETEIGTQPGEAEAVDGVRTPRCGILIVDDDALSSVSFRRILQDAGHEVYHAPDAAIALDMLRLARQPLVVLLNIMLPPTGGVDVLQTAEKDACLLTGHAVVLLMRHTCKLSTSLSRLLVDLPIFVAAKPVDRDTLLAVVAEASAQLRSWDQSVSAEPNSGGLRQSTP